jgi:hypothetical protein
MPSRGNAKPASPARLHETVALPPFVLGEQHPTKLVSGGDSETDPYPDRHD